MNEFDNALLTVCSSLLINLCVTIGDFVYSYNCCTKLSMRYGQKKSQGVGQGWTESDARSNNFGTLELLCAARAPQNLA